MKSNEIGKHVYVLEKLGIVMNYPYRHEVEKGGIIGLYSTYDKARLRRDKIIKEKKLTISDFKISELEFDIVDI